MVTITFQRSEVNCELQSEERSGEVSNQNSDVPMNWHREMHRGALMLLNIGMLTLHAGVCQDLHILL